MADLVALAYTSSSVGKFSERELEELLLVARKRNAEEGVTGVLLYDDGTFFQYIEGPERGIESVYTRVKASTRHRGLIELFRRNIEAREFGSWAMGFSMATTSEILRLAQAQWTDAVAVTQRGNGGLGSRLLREYWAMACRRSPSSNI